MIVFRLIVNDSVTLFNTIPSHACIVGNHINTIEITFSEGNNAMNFSALIVADLNNIILNNVVTNWNSWQLDIIGIL